MPVSLVRWLVHVIRVLSDLAAPKKATAMLQDAPRLAIYEQATGAMLKHLPGVRFVWLVLDHLCRAEGQVQLRA